jgi:uncharacterized protein
MAVAYLDIETNYIGTFLPTEDRFFRDAKHHLITVLGVRVVDGEADSFAQLVHTEATRERLLRALGGVTRIVTYNGRSIPDVVKGRVGFDFPVIEAQLGIVLDREFAHTDLVPVCWQKGLYGGQKKVEETLGLRRTLPGKHGAWAMDTWRKYLASGEKNLLEELLLYNKEDVFMLRELEHRLANR